MDGIPKALSDRDTWLRAPVLLLFYLLLVLVTPVLVLVSVVGWFALLIRGRVPDEVSDLGRNLAAWYEQTARYLTGGARRRPFPFEDLDCPTDEPDRPGAGPAAFKTRSAGAPLAASSGPTAGGAQTSSKKKSAKKTGQKKISKKTSKKKTGKKKAGGKKSAVKKAETPSQPEPAMAKEAGHNE